MSADHVQRIELDVEQGDAADLSWWRRPRKLRRQLAGALVGVALASVLLVGGLNFVAARQLLDDGTKDQLAGVGEARARSIDLGLDRTLGSVSALAADLAVVASLEELDETFARLSDEQLTAEQDAAVDDAYRNTVVDPVNALELDLQVTLDDVVPTTDAGRYAQFHYTLDREPDTRREMLDAGDGSDYSAVHAARHTYLMGLADTLGLGDLILLNAAGEVVYSVEKRIDFATSLAGGPHATSNLAVAFKEELARVPVGESVVADLELYLPGGARPVIFVVASIRRETEVIGALAAQIPAASVNALTTAGERWEEVGLSTGESYLVGPDRTLISESRLWLEDPDEYLDKVDTPEAAAAIEAFGSPVGLQVVDTEPVEAALDGRVFEGTTKNYLGESTFSYATPITARGVEWIVVADIPLGEARGPLYDYARQLGIVLLIILPIAAIIGLWMAGRLTRPIPPVVAAARAVAEGERDPDITDLGNDEFGDLGRRLKQMAGELERQELALAQEYEDRRELLLTVLPPRIVRSDGVVTGTGGAAETATVVAVSLQSDAAEHASEDNLLARVLTEALDIAERLADDDGIERIRAARDQYLFVAGLGDPDDEADAALDFATKLSVAIAARAEEEEVPLGVHIGLSSGPIATGVLERGNLTFAAWGEAVRRALAIGALAQQDEVLVDASTAASASDDRWTMTPATDVVALDGQPMSLFTVLSTEADPAAEPA